jgi:riboflavin kinase/FMN adenylyltransferase
MIECYNVKGIIVGFNYRFGYKNLGDIELLQQLSDDLGFEVHIVEPVKLNGEIISSSQIRHLLSEGDIEKSNDFLTRPFMLEGKVIKGNNLVESFISLRLIWITTKIYITKRGVYYTIVEYNDIRYKGITNIGYNPTVKDKKLSIENSCA